MFWLYLALLAYFINAIVFIIDKHLLSSSIPKPFAYAFGVSILSSLSFILIPFGTSWRGIDYTLIALFSGAVFFLALVFLYRAIKESDVLVASTHIGVLTAIFTLLFSTLLLGTILKIDGYIAFIFLIFGIFFMGIAGKNAIKNVVLAAVFLALSSVLLKWSFNLSNFIDGVFWTRVGFVSTAFSVLIFPLARKEIKHSFKDVPKSSLGLFIFNKILAGIGFLILYYAIRLGEVSLVNALLGVQFAFVFILTLLFRKRIPAIRESNTTKAVTLKLLAILFIVIGFALLFK